MPPIFGLQVCQLENFGEGRPRLRVDEVRVAGGDIFGIYH